jgi:hypothetical protein
MILGDDDVSDRQNTTQSPSAAEPQCIVAATAGGDGGRGGLLSIHTASGVALDGTVRSGGGAAGEAGTASRGPLAHGGTAGDAGSTELLLDPDLTFDESLLSEAAIISVGVDGVDDVIAVGGTDAAPLIAVERLELGPGATLGISRFPTIIARKLIIAEGARLVLRDAGSAVVAVGEEGSLGEPGLSGGAVTILAQEIAVDGTLDASGSSGASGGDGGDGGQLQIRAEVLKVGLTGAITVAGGSGGSGTDEQLCQE